MKGEKKSRVDFLEKKVDALIRVVQKLLEDNTHIKDLSVGTLEVVKLMDGYKEAIEKLKDSMSDEKTK
jgi:hypothetical protein